MSGVRNASLIAFLEEAPDYNLLGDAFFAWKSFRRAMTNAVQIAPPVPRAGDYAQEWQQIQYRVPVASDLLKRASRFQAPEGICNGARALVQRALLNYFRGFGCGPRLPATRKQDSLWKRWDEAAMLLIGLQPQMWYFAPVDVPRAQYPKQTDAVLGLQISKDDFVVAGLDAAGDKLEEIDVAQMFNNCCILNQESICRARTRQVGGLMLTGWLTAHSFLNTDVVMAELDPLFFCMHGCVFHHMSQI